LDLHVIETNRGSHRIQYALDNFFTVVGGPHAVEHQDELVSPPTAKGVPFPQLRRQSISELLEQSIADFMTESFIDRLEIIDIQIAHQHGILGSPGPCQIVSQPVDQ
jgi:hypothetical protein